MSAVAQKKKRFEGLSQFKGYPRQALVCLQASLKGQIATEAQSSYLKELNDNATTPYTSLILSLGQILENINSSNDLENHHALIRIQLDRPNEQALSLSEGLKSKSLTAHINSKSYLHSYYLWTMLSQIGHTGNFDHKIEYFGFGSTQHSINTETGILKEELSKWSSQKQLSTETTHRMLNISAEIQSLFTHIRQVDLSTDGVYLCLAFNFDKPNLSGARQMLNCCHQWPIELVCLSLNTSMRLECFLPIHSFSTDHPTISVIVRNNIHNID